MTLLRPVINEFTTLTDNAGNCGLLYFKAIKPQVVIDLLSDNPQLRCNPKLLHCIQERVPAQVLAPVIMGLGYLHPNLSTAILEAEPSVLWVPPSVRVGIYQSVNRIPFESVWVGESVNLGHYDPCLEREASFEFIPE